MLHYYFQLIKPLWESKISIPVNTARLEFHTGFYIAERFLIFKLLINRYFTQIDIFFIISLLKVRYTKGIVTDKLL